MSSQLAEPGAAGQHAAASPAAASGGQLNDHVSYCPAGELGSLISSYAGYRQQGMPPGRHRGLPSPDLTFIVTLDDPLVMAAHPDPAQPPGRYQALVAGLHSSPAIIEFGGRQSGIQLALSPLAARALIGMPAAELASLDVHADEVLGPAAFELTERVREAAGWRAKFAVLDEILAARAAAADGTAVCDELRFAWQWLERTGGTARISSLAAQTGWSDRHLRSRFLAEFGLTPKAAARVIRFHRARRRVQQRAVTTGELGLADIAAEGGYYDQAHLDRDFRDLAGCPPTAWVAEEFRNFQATELEPVPA
jgi:AraC-like DNA-binding protein